MDHTDERYTGDYPSHHFFQFLSNLILSGSFTARHKLTSPWYFRINNVFSTASNYGLEKKEKKKTKWAKSNKNKILWPSSATKTKRTYCLNYKRREKTRQNPWTKGYIIQICQMGGCLGLKIRETLTKHLYIMINAKNDKKQGPTIWMMSKLREVEQHWRPQNASAKYD